MSRRLLAGVTLAALTIACQSGTDREGRDLTSDYAVYAAALDSLIVRAGGESHVVVLSPNVGGGRGMASVEAMGNDAVIPPDVRRDFMAKNAARVPLVADYLRLSVPTVVIPSDSIRAIAALGKDPWAAIMARFPGINGLVELSRVGFSDDSTHALLYLGWSCPLQCSSGWKVQLRRPANGAWRVTSADLSWVE